MTTFQLQRSTAIHLPVAYGPGRFLFGNMIGADISEEKSARDLGGM